VRLHFNAVGRELDFDVFNVLKVGLITKAALDTNMNTKVISVLTGTVTGE